MIRTLRKLLKNEPEPGAQLRVLMVCMGNICRSPTAEAVLRAKLRAAGLASRIAVDSAGTVGHHIGEPPDARAVSHAAARGYDLSALRARQVQPADFARFDWLLAMDEDNLEWLRRHAPPDAPGRCERLLALVGGPPAPLDVPDPYYGGPAGFDHVLDLLEEACDRLVPLLARQLEAVKA